MARAGTPARAGKDRTAGAAEQQEVADALRGVHDRLGLWRLCTNKACRRRRRCGGDVDECGARCFAEAWAWVHHVSKAMRAGRSPRAAARAADRDLLPKPRPTILVHYPGFGETYEMVVADEHVDQVRASQAEANVPSRRLAASHSPWLRAALPR